MKSLPIDPRFQQNILRSLLWSLFLTTPIFLLGGKWFFLVQKNLPQELPSLIWARYFRSFVLQIAKVDKVKYLRLTPVVTTWVPFSYSLKKGQLPPVRPQPRARVHDAVGYGNPAPIHLSVWPGCGQGIITKNFRYLKWRYFSLIRLFWGRVFPYISRIHTAYIGFRTSTLGTSTWNVLVIS